jgi:hypothetical protein
MAKAPGELDVHLRIHRVGQGRSQRASLRTPLKQLHARGTVLKPLAADSQPVMVKVDTPGPKAKGIQTGYLQQGKGHGQTEAPLYGPAACDAQGFTQRVQADAHRFTLVVSFPEFPQLPHFNRTAFIEQYMRQVERDLGTALEWLAADHYDTGHPHTHIVVRGVSATGEELYMKPSYYLHGLREQASRLLTLVAGPVREREQTLEQAQFRTYQESLGHGPKRLNGIILGSDDPDLGQLTRQQIVSRAQPPQGGVIPLARPPVPQLYGHEGMAAHVQQLWARMQGPQYQPWPGQQLLLDRQRDLGR